MKIATSIKIKAALLLAVFSLNTAISAACAMGLNPDFNTSHHTEEATESAVHVHADGKQHHHDNEQESNSPELATTVLHKKQNSSPKDDCCTEEVMQFQQLAKNLPAKPGIEMPVLVAIATTFFGIDIFKTVKVPSKKYSGEYFHPPQPDIRIAIQSFQI